MNRFRSRLLLLCALLTAIALAGCGQKGKLYLPDQDRPASLNQPG